MGGLLHKTLLDLREVEIEDRENICYYTYNAFKYAVEMTEALNDEDTALELIKICEAYSAPSWDYKLKEELSAVVAAKTAAVTSLLDFIKRKEPLYAKWVPHGTE